MATKLSDPARNALAPSDRAVHDWYRFVLSFPPHLVRGYLDRFSLTSGKTVLDPFCGTGTTVVEAKKHRVAGQGIEANPVAHLASHVKTDWSPDPAGLSAHAATVAELALARLKSEGISDFEAFSNGRTSMRQLSPEQMKLLLTDSISPLPLHKTLVLTECLAELRDDRYHAHEQVALAKTLVHTSSNLKFGPEVGVGKAKADAPVVVPWRRAVDSMAEDLVRHRELSDVPTTVHRADARNAVAVLEPESVDAVFTSPPYPNEKDYSRTTRLELVLLGFASTMAELRALKQQFVRSNTRSVYVADDDDAWIADHLEVQRLAADIEQRRQELGKTSGFERNYARVTKLYFGGMARHLAELRPVLRPGAYLGYVVGDQASYLQIMIRTGRILADIAASLGYEVVGIDLFRTRLATATREQLREEVVVLRWPG